MRSERIFNVPEVKNMKEVIYTAVKNYSDNIAFVILKDIKTQNPIYLQYKRFLES